MTTTSNLFDKDSAQVSVSLRGATLTGTVTDSDLLCLYSLLFLEPEERKQMERKGSGTLLTVVQERQRQWMAELQTSALNEIVREQPTLDRPTAEKQALDKASKDFDAQLTEAIYHRVNNSSGGSTRREFVARLIEIFPDIDRNLVSFDPSQGIARLRLSSVETMQLTMSLLGALSGLSYDKPKPEEPPIQPEVVAETSQLENNGGEENGNGSAIVLTQPEPVSSSNEYGLSDELVSQLSPQAKAKLGLM